MQEIRRHQCLIYQGAPSRHLDRVAREIVEKLRTNTRCLYLNSPALVVGMRSRLWTLGLDVAREVNEGGLLWPARSRESSSPKLNTRISDKR
jgi:hypothetical protein